MEAERERERELMDNLFSSFETSFFSYHRKLTTSHIYRNQDMQPMTTYFGLTQRNYWRNFNMHRMQPHILTLHLMLCTYLEDTENIT